jgi:hypothetical protein
MKTLPMLALAALGAVAAPGRASDDASMQVEFRIMKRGVDAPLISGKVPLEEHRTMQFEQHAPSGGATISVNMTARPHDGRTSMELQIEERTPDGERVSWKPTFQVRRGDKIDASMDWTADGRRLELTVK